MTFSGQPWSPAAPREMPQGRHSYSRVLGSLTSPRLARPVSGKIKKIRF